MQRWAEDGYAVFSMSDRGWGNSCGGDGSRQRLQPAACADGYNHLMDTRFEVRDAQELSRRSLVDEARREPVDRRSASTAAPTAAGSRWRSPRCRDRVMLAEREPRPPGSARRQDDGDRGRAARHPLDRPRLLADCRTATRSTTSRTRPTSRGTAIGVHEAVLRRRPLRDRPGDQQLRARRATDPDADLINWYAQINAGEPYDAEPARPRTSPTRSRPTTPRYYIDYSHRPGAAADLERLDRRPVPARRGDPLLQPDPQPVPGRADLPVLQRPRPPARSEQGRRTQRSAHRAADDWFDYYLKGDGPGARPRASRR